MEWAEEMLQDEDLIHHLFGMPNMFQSLTAIQAHGFGSLMSHGLQTAFGQPK